MTYAQKQSKILVQSDLLEVLMKRAEKIFVNGRFLTMEREGELTEAVAVADGRILYVGTEEKAHSFADEDTELIDLGGRVHMAVSGGQIVYQNK